MLLFLLFFVCVQMLRLYVNAKRSMSVKGEGEGEGEVYLYKLCLSALTGGDGGDGEYEQNFPLFSYSI